ncbi:hypothetical protein [Paenibacillus polymyxa]|uniref:hypothetical protein n=2 Tax=Paenibacillus polymyxa TaxID=1406 RepID=UPI00037500BF|nr:hypothetical protein [Paenibacillus polymyxa]
MEELNTKLLKTYSYMSRISNSTKQFFQKQRVDKLMDEIVRLRKGQGRMKYINYIKRCEKAIADGETIVNAFEVEISTWPDRELYTLFPSPKAKENHLINEPEIKEEISRRGGKRKGAGRKPIGEKPVVRKVSITLPQEEWDRIDKLIDGAKFKNLAHYFRVLAIEAEKSED